MEIGLHQPIRAEDAGIIADLGVTWTKFGGDLSDTAVAGGTETHFLRQPTLDREFDLADSMGLRCVVDLRTHRGYIEQVALALIQELKAQGAIRTVDDIPDQEEFRRYVVERNKEIYQRALRPLCDAAAETALRYRGRCQDWEFWGESNCPWVTQGAFAHRYATYPGILNMVADAIHAAVPEARVWTGGNGMNGDINWALAIMHEGAGECFDVLNMHPYFIQVRHRPSVQRLMARNYTLLREALQAEGRNQLFAASEWGYPTLDEDSREIETYLRSHVVSDGIRQLYWSEAEEWFNGDLEAMQRHGFEVVIVHSLHDDKASGIYWGQCCGLIDTQGRRKNVFGVVQQWAWAGREGRPAFSTEGKGLP